VRDEINLTGQHFDWSVVENREKFLQLQNGSRRADENGKKLTDDEIKLLARECAGDDSIREMTNCFVMECSSRRSPQLLLAAQSKSGDDDKKSTNWMCFLPPWS
jgi:hypothetical protein